MEIRKKEVQKGSVAEADEFRKNFKEQYDREPSSGELQMDWLRKQGIVK